MDCGHEESVDIQEDGDMGETYDWPGFYGALCEHGPHLLVGLAEDDGEIIEALAADTDTFWSDGLQPLLADAAGDGDLRLGVLASLGLWRENVLIALSEDFSIDLDWDAVAIDADSPLIEALVEAATPGDS